MRKTYNRNPRLTELVIDILLKKPDKPSRTLARELNSVHPKIGSVEQFRQSIRSRRGAHGEKQRQHMPYKIPAGTNKYFLPESYYKNWEPFEFNEFSSALVLADLHIPYHNQDAINAAFDCGLHENVDAVIINGDIWDCHQMSRFEKDPEARDTVQEYEAVLQFRDSLEEAFPKAKVLWKIGNHDARLDRYIAANVPEVAKLKLFRWEQVLQAEDYLTIIPHKKPVKCGDLWILHGDEWKNMGGTVNPARSAYLRLKECAVVAHNHQPSSHIEGSIADRFVQTWSQGCCCGLRPFWLPVNNWCHGFALVRMNGGQFSVENKKIVKGKVYPA